MKKQLLTLCCIAAIAFAMTACGDDSSSTSSTTTQAATQASVATTQEATTKSTQATTSSANASDSENTAEVVGVWYKNGVANADTYLTFMPDGSCEKYEYQTTTTGAYTVGEYQTGAPQLNGVTIGEDYVSEKVEFDDFFFNEDCTLVAGGLAMIPFDGDEFYVHESAIGNQNLLYLVNVLVREWKESDDSGETIFFYANGAAAYIGADSTDVQYTADWTLIENTIVINWSNGETMNAEISLEGEHALMTFTGQDVTFTNKSIWE